MPLCRNLFVEVLAKESAKLKVVFLNHTGNPDILQTDLSSVDLLIDKPTVASFVNFCKRHPMVKQFILDKQLHQSSLHFTFEDGSELKMNLIHNKQKNGLLLLQTPAILAAAVLTPTSFLSPSFEHHYEYILLQCQLEGIPVPERYRKYFSSMDGEKRVRIFSYLQKKYNLIFNSIDELFSPDENTRLQLIIGLRKLKANTLLKVFFRSLRTLLFSLTGGFRKSKIILCSSLTDKKHFPANERENRAAL